MRHRMMILAAGLFAALAVNTASAQAPAPLQTPPAQRTGFACDQVAVTQAGCASCSAPVVVNGCGSCSGVQTVEGHKRQFFGFGGGVANPTACGCWASDKTFLFGSCSDYFNPKQTCGGGPCGGNCSGGYFRNPCSLPKYGTGIGQPANNCAGPYTYIMR